MVGENFSLEIVLGFIFFITVAFYDYFIIMTVDDDALYYEVLRQTKKELMELGIYKAHRRKWFLIY